MSATYTKFEAGWKKIEVYPHSDFTIKPRPVMGVEEIQDGSTIKIAIRCSKGYVECVQMRSEYLTRYNRNGYGTKLSAPTLEGNVWVSRGTRYSSCD